MGGLRFPDLKLDIEAASLEPMEGQRRCALDRALWPLGVVDRARERSSVPRLRAAHQSDEIAGSPAPQAARRGGNNKFAFNSSLLDQGLPKGGNYVCFQL